LVANVSVIGKLSCSPTTVAELLTPACGTRAGASPSISKRLDRPRPAVLEVAKRHGASNLRLYGSVALNQEQDRLLGCPVDVVEADWLHPMSRAAILQYAVRL
jgi:predicted nucleotidyltransferase